MKNKKKLGGLLLALPLLLSSSPGAPFGQLSTYGGWDKFYFVPLAATGESSRHYEATFKTKAPGFFNFTVGLTNSKFPNEKIIGNSVNYYLYTDTPTSYTISFDLTRDILTETGNKLRVSCYVYDYKEPTTFLVRLHSYFVFSLAQERTWTITGLATNNVFTREKNSDGCSGRMCFNSTTFTSESYRIFYYGYARDYQDPWQNRLPLKSWRFRSLRLDGSEISPQARNCYLEIEKNQEDFACYGETKYEQGVLLRRIPLIVEYFRLNNLGYCRLLLRDGVAISKDGRRIKKASEAGIDDIIVHQVYLPPLPNGVSARNYSFKLVMNEMGEYGFDTLVAPFNVTKTHNVLGPSGNSDWHVEEERC
jgi:hypothetical protein